jgi:hypothetical protein
VPAPQESATAAALEDGARIGVVGGGPLVPFALVRHGGGVGLPSVDVYEQ